MLRHASRRIKLNCAGNKTKSTTMKYAKKIKQRSKYYVPVSLTTQHMVVKLIAGDRMAAKVQLANVRCTRWESLVQADKKATGRYDCRGLGELGNRRDSFELG